MSKPLPMAKQKPTNRLEHFSRGEKMIHYSCLGIIGFFIVNLLMMIVSEFREYLCADFPNLYFIGLHALFIAASIRMNEAYTHGSISLDASISNKLLNDNTERLLDSRPNYSVRSYNAVYLITIVSSAGMMLFHLFMTVFIEQNVWQIFP